MRLEEICALRGSLTSQGKMASVPSRDAPRSKGCFGHELNKLDNAKMTPTVRSGSSPKCFDTQDDQNPNCNGMGMQSRRALIFSEMWL